MKHKLLAVIAGTALVLTTGVIAAGSASAHVAPPIGSASCTDSANWAASGSATVADAGKDLVKLTITSTAGTVVQAPLSTVSEHNGQKYTYTVSAIPVGIDSITVTSTLTWGNPDNPTTNHQTTIIGEPQTGCVVAPQGCDSKDYTGLSTPDALNGWANDPSSDTDPTYISDPSATDGKGEISLVIPAGDNSKTKVTWQHAVNPVVALAGISGLGYKDDTTAGSPAFRPAYQLVVDPHTTLTFATLNWEPGNGNPPDGLTSGWVTNANVETGVWWTTKITVGPGSQAEPAKLSVIDALWPDATVEGYGVNVGHLGGNNTDAIVSNVDDISFLCGVTNFEPKTVVVTTSSSTSPAPSTSASTSTPAPSPSTSTALPTPTLTQVADTLPNTGVDSGELIALGLVLLLAGLAVLYGPKLARGRNGGKHS